MLQPLHVFPAPAGKRGRDAVFCPDRFVMDERGKAEGPAVPPFALGPGGGPDFFGDFKLRASNSAF